MCLLYCMWHAPAHFDFYLLLYVTVADHIHHICRRTDHRVLHHISRWHRRHTTGRRLQCLLNDLIRRQLLDNRGRLILCDNEKRNQNEYKWYWKCTYYSRTSLSSKWSSTCLHLHLHWIILLILLLHLVLLVLLLHRWLVLLLVHRLLHGQKLLNLFLQLLFL